MKTSRTYSVQDWLDSIFNLAELLSLTENELCQLEELDGDIALAAAWWRRRIRGVRPAAGDHRNPLGRLSGWSGVERRWREGT